MASRTAVLDRVERLLRAGLTAKAFRERVLAELRPVLPYDGHVWLLTDPLTRVGTSPLADVPALDLRDLPNLGRLRYLTTVNRWDVLVDEGRHAATLLGETGGEPDAVAAVARVPVRARGHRRRVGRVRGPVRLLGLARPVAHRDGVRAGDAAFLAELAPVLTVGLREAQARTFVDDAAALDLSGPAVIVLGPGPRGAQPDRLGRRGAVRAEPARRPGAHRAGRGLQRGRRPARRGGRGAGGRAVVAGAPRRRSLGDPAGRPDDSASRSETGDVVVTIAVSTPQERREVFALAHGLTPREREVLAEVARGLDSRAVADRLVVSEHTVHDHVKAVLAKTGTATRQALLARIAGAA